MTQRVWSTLSSNRAANVLLALTCVAVLAYLLFGRGTAESSVEPEAVARENVWPAGTPAPFDVVALPGGPSRHIVLMLHSTCRFCGQEMPFYRELAAEAVSSGIRLHVAGIEDEATLRGYAEAHGLAVESVFPEVVVEGLRSTPTVLLLDGAGLVERSWQGVMSDDQKADLKGTL